MAILLRRLVLACAGLAVVAVLLFALAHLPAVRLRVLSWAAGRLAAQSGLTLTADRLDYNLANLSASAHGVTIAAPDRPDAPLLQADAIRADIPWSALTGVFSLSSLEIDGARILIVRDEQGRFNLPDRGSAAAATARRLRIDRLSVGDLAFKYDDRGRDMAVEAVGLSLVMEPDGPGRIAGPLTAGGTLALSIGASSTTTNLSGRIGYDGESIDLAKLGLSGPEGVLALDGRIASVLGSPALDLTYEADLDIDRAAAWAPVANRPTGRLTATGRLDGPLDDLRVTTDVNARGVEWLGITGMDVNANVDVSADALSLTRLDMKLPKGELTGSGRVPLAAGGPMEMRLGWRNLDARQLVPMLPEAVPPLAATLEGMLEFQWSGAERRQVRLDLVNHSTPQTAGTGELSLAGDVDLLVEQGRWRATLDHDVGSAAQVAGELAGELGATWSESTIRGDLTATSSDMARLSRDLARSGLVSTVATQGLAGAIDVNARISGRLNAPGADGTIAGHEVAARGFGPAELAGGFDVNDRRLDVRGLEARAGSNLATIDASYAFGSGAIGGRMAGSLEQVSEFTEALPEAWRPSGALAFDVHLGGTATRPQVTGRFTGSNLEVAAQPVVSAEGGIRLEDDLLTIESLDLVQPGGGRMGGRVVYNTRTEAIELALDGRELAIGALPPGTVAAEPFDLSAVLDLQLAVQGTRAEPVGSGRLAFSTLRMKGTDLGAPTVGIGFHDGAAWIDASLDQYALTVAGSVSLVTPYESRVTATATNADLRSLAGLVGEVPPGVMGTTSFSVTASGPLASWQEIDLEGTLSALDARIDERPIVLLQPGGFRYVEEEITADRLELGSGQARVGLSGTLSQGNRTGRISATMAGPLDDLMPFARLAGAPENVSARGVVDVRVDLSGSLGRPVVAGTFSLENGDLIWSTFSAGGVTARGAVQDGVVRMDTLTGYWQGAAFTGSGVVPLAILGDWLPADLVAALPASPPEAALKLRVENLTAASFSPWLPPETAAELDGRTTLDIDLRAPRLELAALTGTLTIEDTVLSFSRVPIVQELPTRVTFGNGEVAVDAARLSGAGTVLVAGGTAFLTRDTPELDLQAHGSVDLRVLGAFSRDVATSGLAEVKVRAEGPWNAPRVTGRMDLQNAELRLRTPRVAVTQLSGVVTLAEHRFVLEGLRGFANGGDVEINGELTHKGAKLVGGKVDLVARGMGLEYPEGLRSLFDSDLALTVAEEGRPILSGTVTIQRAAYRRRLSVMRQLLARGDSFVMESGGAAGASLLGSIGLDLRIVTAEDIVVDNNYARLELTADLRLTGTIAQPGAGGRATIREAGQIYLGGNTYLIERGSIDFLNPNAIEPTLDISARTRVSRYDVTMNVSGAPGAIQTDLVSDPSLGQDDIVSLLLTGRTLGQSGRLEVNSGQAPVLALLSGELLSAAGGVVGLDRVRFEQGLADDTNRVDPGYVATETDPAARLTIAKHFREDVELIVSRNLNTGELTWIASYQPGRLFEIRAITRDNNDNSYEFSQDLSFGGPPRARRLGRPEEQRRVSSIVFSGTPGFPQDQLMNRLRVKVGDRFDFYRWQDDQDRLLELYHDRGFYEARVNAHRSTEDLAADQLRLEYAVERGPATRLVIQGTTLSGRLQNDIREAWTRSVYDDFLLDDIRTLTRRWLVGEGYLQGSVVARVDGSGGDEKVITVTIGPGQKTSSRQITFEGNHAIDSGDISAIVQARQLGNEAWIDPEALRQAVVDLYRSRGWLGAGARVGDPVFAAGRASLPVTIDEGARYTVGTVRLSGVTLEREEAVRTALAVKASEPYDPARLTAGRAAVDELYRRDGFGRIATSTTVTADPEQSSVDVTLAVNEGVRQVLASVSVVGAEHTHLAFLTRALNLKIGSPVSQSEWYAARKRLYDTGVFRRVDIEAAPIENASAVAGSSVVEERVEAHVTLEEAATTRFRYGLQLNDTRDPATDEHELGPGFSANLERFNLFGRAAKAGVAFRYDNNNRIGRTYFIAPRFFGLPLVSGVYLSRERQLFGVREFVSDTWEATAEQRFRPGRRLEIAYGYQFERNRTFDRNPRPNDPLPLDVVIRVSKLISTATLDTRDDPFNAATGWFHSSSLEYAPEGLGSDVRFVKYLAQQYYYRPLVSKLVFASAARIGVADGFGQNVIPSERFFAGGGNSVRGYREDSLGEVDVFGVAEGGEALLELSEELRFPVYRWLGGVAFVDAGNVFPSPAEISFSDLKVGVGLGMRLDTPIVLLRVDYGVPLSPDVNGEKKGRWFFSIGQAF